jgi:hypothetical protein
MIWGEPKSGAAISHQSFLAVAPKLAFLIALVAMGIYMPQPVNDLFREVATSLGAQ